MNSSRRSGAGKNILYVHFFQKQILDGALFQGEKSLLAHFLIR